MRGSERLPLMIVCKYACKYREEFTHADAGQMNMYLNYYEDTDPAHHLVYWHF